jgi:predicted outer membrane repeat protein
MKIFFPLLLALGAFLPGLHATRWYVNAATGNDANTGASWAQSYKTFQKALNVTNSGDEIWLSSGTYRPTQDLFGGTVNKYQFCFAIKKAVSIYGGFAGTETTIAQRIVSTPPTYLSGDVDGDDLANPAQAVTDLQGTNCNQVVIINNGSIAGTITIDGVTVTASGGEGGLQIVNGATNNNISNCRFTGNFASSNNDNFAFGGILVFGASGTGAKATIDHCTFDHNNNNSGGSGIHVWAGTAPSSATISNCSFHDLTGAYGTAISAFAANGLTCNVVVSDGIFLNNSCGGNGGAIGAAACFLSCTNCSFQQNHAVQGGAISTSEMTNGYKMLLVGCFFSNNTSDYGGGAIYSQSSELFISNSNLQFNTATNGDGAGILFDNYIFNYQPIETIDNCIFYLNHTSAEGGGICIHDPNATVSITNSKFRANYSQNGGGIAIDNADNSSAAITIKNDLFYNNEGAFGHGAAIYWRQAPGTAHNNVGNVSFCSFYSNFANVAGNDVFADNVTFTGFDLVSWGSVNAFGEFGSSNGGHINVSNSLMQSASCQYAGIDQGCTGNIFNQNPLFIDASNGNFHLPMCSPGVNTGDVSNVTTTDFDNNPRPYNDGTGRQDMGAYEFQGTPPNTYYRDKDGDGYGVTTDPVIRACSLPAGFATVAGDCNDNAASINPGAVEICDGIDNNCNNLIDYLDPTYVDHTPPVFNTTVPNITLTCTDLIPAAPTVTATDNCAPTVSVTFSQTSTRSSDPNQCGYYSYVITRKWTSTDLKNNVAVMTQTITVQDNQPPVLSATPANITVECTPPQAAFVTAKDNCSPNVSVVLKEVRTDGACAQTYTLTRTWTATDACGNTATASQVIQVQDTKPPFVLFPPVPVITLECDQAIPPVPHFQTQDCDPNPIQTVDEQTEIFDANPFDHIFTRITRQIAVTDHCGNATTFTQVINIRDTHPPVITNCPGNITVQGTEDGADVTYADANVKENCSYDLYYTPYGPGGHFPLGTTQIYIDAYDKGGNYGECAFTITVVDKFEIHCQQTVPATVPYFDAAAKNEVRWNKPFTKPCQFCDTQEGQGDFKQQFQFLGTLDGHRYYMSKQKTNIATADLTCTEYHGYLVSIGDKRENTFLQNELAGIPVLTGYNDAAQEGTFTWEDGQGYPYANWQPGSPATGNAGMNRDYVVLDTDGRWKNILNTDSVYFVLEVPCYRIQEQNSNVPADHQMGVGTYDLRYLVSDICGQKDTCHQTAIVSHQPFEYCMPNYNVSTLDQDTSLWIQSANFGNFGEVTGNNKGYYRHTGLATTLKIGETYPVHVKIGRANASGPVNAYIRVWIDYNVDRDFYDAGELVLDTFSTTGDVTAFFKIPAGAKIGDLRQRIRIATSRYAAPEACGDYPIGETEDYRIAIAAPTNVVNRPGATDRDETSTAPASIQVYPNPAAHATWLDLSSYGETSCTIQMLNSTGQLMQSIPVAQANAETVRIDLTRYTSGLYFIRILDAESRTVQTEKLVVQKN